MTVSTAMNHLRIKKVRRPPFHSKEFRMGKQILHIDPPYVKRVCEKGAPVRSSVSSVHVKERIVQEKKHGEKVRNKAHMANDLVSCLM